MRMWNYALLVLILLTGLSKAGHADTFQYTVLEGSTMFSFTEPTLASSGDVTSGFFSVTVPAGDSLTGFSWNSAAGAFCPFSFGGSVAIGGLGCTAISLSTGPSSAEGIYAGFTPGSFLAPGVFTSQAAAAETVTITDISVPEPSSITLLALGALALGLGSIYRRTARTRSAGISTRPR